MNWERFFTNALPIFSIVSFMLFIAEVSESLEFFNISRNFFCSSRSSSVMLIDYAKGWALQHDHPNFFSRCYSLLFFSFSNLLLLSLVIWETTSWLMTLLVFSSSLLLTPNITDQQSFFIFLINSKDNVEYYILFGIPIVGLIKTYQSKLSFAQKVLFLIF